MEPKGDNAAAASQIVIAGLISSSRRTEPKPTEGAALHNSLDVTVHVHHHGRVMELIEVQYASNAGHCLTCFFPLTFKTLSPYPPSPPPSLSKAQSIVEWLVQPHSGL